jgi:hypothetical protein
VVEEFKNLFKMLDGVSMPGLFGLLTALKDLQTEYYVRRGDMLDEALKFTQPTRVEETHEHIKAVCPGTIYLAGPICGLSSAKARGWRQEAQACLASNGLFGLSPCGKEKWKGADIVDSDLGSIRGCSGILAHIPATGAASIGTSQELFYAYRVCKPRKFIVVWGQEFNSDPCIQSPFLNQHCDRMFLTLDTALQYIVGNPALFLTSGWA